MFAVLNEFSEHPYHQCFEFCICKVGYLSEIKKDLQGTRSGEGEAENQINNSEHKEGKSIQSEQQEEKRLKKIMISLGTPGTTLNVPPSKS